jgi:hypothetical protein
VTESNRKSHEQKAQMQSSNDNDPGESGWREWPPVLDEAMDRLGQADHNALLWRYFQNNSLREVGMA